MLFLLFANISNAGRQALDSLFEELDNMVEDSVKIKLYNDLSWEYNNNSPVKSMEYAHKAYLLAIKNNDLQGEAEAFNNIGNAFYFLSYYDTANYFYYKSLKIKERLGDKKGASSTLSNLAMIYDIKGEYDSAIAIYTKALGLKEEINDTVGMVNVLSNIGVMHMVLGKHEIALDYFHKCILFENYASDLTLGNIYSNIGLIYYDYADTSKGMTKSEYFNVSLSYNKKAIEVRRAIDDNYGLSISYTNIANLYEQFRNYDKAIENYKATMQIQKAIEDQNGLALSLHNLGRMYFNLKQYNRAIDFIEKSQKMSIQIGNYDFVKDNFKVLSTIYEEMGSHSTSLSYYKKYTELKDSIININALRQLNQMQVAFKTKEAELKLVKKEDELKRTQLSKNKLFNLGLIILVVISIIFAFFLHASLKEVIWMGP